jgi:branched-chain amino acid aminotransferase
MPPFTPTRYIWKDGSLVPWDAAQTHVSAHALQYGTGVFEGMRAYDSAESGPAIFRLDDHLRRFAVSAAHYELALPFSFEQLCAAALEVVRANGLSNAYLRPLAFFDSYSFAVWPKDCPVTVAIIAVPGRVYIDGADRGIRVMISSTRRIDASMLPPHVKACGHYTNSVRAVQEAMRKGFDEAILLNIRGDVAEGSGANLFIVKRGGLITNDMDASILPGITRDSVLTIARDLGVPLQVRPLSVADMRDADELFFSGTAVEVMPIRQVDDRVIGDGTPGPVTRRLRAAYQDAVHGREARYHHWLARVAEPAAAASAPGG